MAVSDMGASFTVYQPGFVITARELKWSLWNGNPKERAGTIEKSNRKGSKLGKGTTTLNFKETETNKIHESPMGRDGAGRKVFFTYSSLCQHAHLSAPAADST